jgi:hypothetical protein
MVAMKPIPAKGLTGSLIYSQILGKFMFRVYDMNHEFTDYDIHHSDMTIQILDDDAYLYNDGLQPVLDHSPETLGLDSKDA